MLDVNKGQIGEMKAAIERQMNESPERLKATWESYKELNEIYQGYDLQSANSMDVMGMVRLWLFNGRVDKTNSELMAILRKGPDELTKKMLSTFGDIYDWLYERDEQAGTYITKEESKWVEIGDELLRDPEAMEHIVMPLAWERHDFFMSDRELAALAMAIWTYGDSETREMLKRAYRRSALRVYFEGKCRHGRDDILLDWMNSYLATGACRGERICRMGDAGELLRDYDGRCDLSRIADLIETGERTGSFDRNKRYVMLDADHCYFESTNDLSELDFYDAFLCWVTIEGKDYGDSYVRDILDMDIKGIELKGYAKPSKAKEA